MSGRVIHFYRRDPAFNRKIRYRMELDEHNVVISETAVEQPPARSEVPGGAAAFVPSLQGDDGRGSSHLAKMASRGIQFAPNDSGGVDLLYVPPLEQSVHSFFIPDVPCFFEGCAQLRAEWAQFLEANGGTDPDCPDCVKGQLMEQFRPRVEPLVKKHLDENPPTHVSRLPGSRD